MPELPEVETFRRGISPYIEGNTIQKVIVRTNKLGGISTNKLGSTLTGQTIQKVDRRGKYLLFNCNSGSLIMHLGMTGSLRILSAPIAPLRHDHLDIVFPNNIRLRLNDPRRFGSVTWTKQDLGQHELLLRHGPEPLHRDFTGRYLHQRSRNRKITVKQLIMDSAVVAGIGNIYANEALFRAGIQPARLAGRISLTSCECLVSAIKDVIKQSILVGGTMIDFRRGVEKAGQFSKYFMVYGRAGEMCLICGSLIKYRRVGQRSIYFCGKCQR